MFWWRHQMPTSLINDFIVGIRKHVQLKVPATNQRVNLIFTQGINDVNRKSFVYSDPSLFRGSAIAGSVLRGIKKKGNWKLNNEIKNKNIRNFQPKNIHTVLQ